MTTFKLIALGVFLWAASLVTAYVVGVKHAESKATVQPDTTITTQMAKIPDVVIPQVQGKTPPAKTQKSPDMRAYNDSLEKVIASLGNNLKIEKAKYREMMMVYEIKRPLSLSDSTVSMTCDMSFIARPLFKDIWNFKLSNIRASYPQREIKQTTLLPQVRHWADIFGRVSVFGEWRNGFFAHNAVTVEPGIVLHFGQLDLSAVPIGIVAINNTAETMHVISGQFNFTQ